MRKRQLKKNKKNSWRRYINSKAYRKVWKKPSQISYADRCDLLRAGEIGHHFGCNLIAVTPEEHREIHQSARLLGRATLRGMVKTAAVMDDSWALLGEVKQCTIGGKEIGPGKLFIKKKSEDTDV